MEAELLDEFQIFSDDADRKTLTRQRAYEALCSLEKNPTAVEIDDFFKENGIDDVDGTINFDQFKDLYEKVETPTVEALEKALEVFDTNHDGQISVDELKEILKRSHDIRGIDVELSEDYVEQILNTILGEADENQDGLLSCKELANYLITNKALDVSTLETE